MPRKVSNPMILTCTHCGGGMFMVGGDKVSLPYPMLLLCENLACRAGIRYQWTLDSDGQMIEMAPLKFDAILLPKWHTDFNRKKFSW